MFKNCISVSGLRFGVLFCLSVMLASVPVRAQAIAGVEIDPSGIVKLRETGKVGPAARPAGAVAQEGGHLAVSLPRFFKAIPVESLQENNRGPILIGDGQQVLVKLERLHVYPDQKDLVVWGRSEPVDLSDPDRPRGRVSGRPALRADDLVELLRLVGPGSRASSFGCSIDMPEGAMPAVQKLVAEPKFIRSSSSEKIRRVAQTIGYQPVRFFGVAPTSPLARPCIEADYLLKRFVLALDRSPIQQVQPPAVEPGVPALNRSWFLIDPAPLRVSADGLNFAFEGQGLRISSSGDLKNDQVSATDGVKKFTEAFNAHFERLAAAVPAYADLWNVADLAVLAALIREDRLHEKAGWDLGQLLSESGYPIPDQIAPRQVQTLANHRSSKFIAGGVKMELNEKVRNRTVDESGSLAAESRLHQSQEAGAVP